MGACCTSTLAVFDTPALWLTDQRHHPETGQTAGLTSMCSDARQRRTVTCRNTLQRQGKEMAFKRSMKTASLTCHGCQTHQSRKTHALQQHLTKSVGPDAHHCSSRYELEL